MALPEMKWRKSTYSTNGQNCVEVAGCAPMVAVRDTMDRSGPALGFSAHDWTAFLASVSK